MATDARAVGLGVPATADRLIDLQRQYFDDSKEKRRITIALAIAVLFHIILLVLHFARDLEKAVDLTPDHQLIAVDIQPPKIDSGAPKGGDSRPKSAPPTPQTTNLPRPSPEVPRVIPTPRPIEVTPIVETTPSLDTRHQRTSDLNIGDISGPPGPGGRGNNNGNGLGNGVGNRIGNGPDGDGGVGVAGRGPYGRPEIQFKPRPQYTEEGRVNKITGVVVVRAIFTSDGRVTNPTVIRGLGYGLDEKAIEAALKIKFRPALKDGRAASVWLTIEVQFSLL